MAEIIPALSLYGNTVNIEKGKFRIRVAGYCLIVHENKILLVNTKSTGKWFFPGGQVEPGETLKTTIKREALEETGIEIQVEKFLTFKEVYFYYDPTDDALQNYAFYFKCKPITFDISDALNVADDESNKPAWVEIDSLKEGDCQKGIYEIIQLL